jgi:hypothetical protein
MSQTTNSIDKNNMHVDTTRDGPVNGSRSESPKSPAQRVKDEQSQTRDTRRNSLRESLKVANVHYRLDSLTYDTIKKLHVGVSYSFNDQLEGIAVNNGMEVFHNSAVPILYEQALKHEKGSAITSSGALLCKSGEKTGRSPMDKRIVCENETKDDIWWGPINIKITEQVFSINREVRIN